MLIQDYEICVCMKIKPCNSMNNALSGGNTLSLTTDIDLCKLCLQFIVLNQMTEEICLERKKTSGSRFMLIGFFLYILESV